jgi:hypothetical protein
MQYQPPRTGAIISLVGSVLVLIGVFFFPLIILSGGIGNVNNAHYPKTELMIVHNLLPSIVGWVGLLFVLPVLAVLFVLGTSIAALFQELSPGIIIARRVIAIAGFIIQILLSLAIYIIYSISLHVDFAIGFVIILVGFVIAIVGTFIN